MQNDQFTLFELNEHIRQVMVLNFPTTVWVSCEIGQVSYSRGHYFLDLVEKDELTDEIKAKSSAVLWRKKYLSLLKELGTTLDALLKDGMQVLLKVKLDFHEVYGIKWIIDEIDPAFTLGQLEVQRQQTILKLQEANMLQVNNQLYLPPVVQRIAVISSETAAGLADFRQQLKSNQFGYRYSVSLFTAAMQGQATEKEVRSRLKSIARRKDDFDCVVIIRGGGARLDLAAFDSYDLCCSIAEFCLPVIVGIGHEIDEVLADMVAHTSLKTPTAVAEFIINRNAIFETNLHEMAYYMQQRIQRQLQQENTLIQEIKSSLNYRLKECIQEEDNKLNKAEIASSTLVDFQLKSANQQLDNLEKTVYLLSPEAAYKRGFSLTTKGDKVIRSKKELKPGDTIKIHLADGEVESKIID